MLHSAGEPADGLWVVAGVGHGFGQQRQRPHRRLELVADVGHEVPADRLDAAVLGLVLGEDQDQPGTTQRGYPYREGGGIGPELADGHFDLGLADHTVAAHLPGQREQVTDDELRAAYDPVGAGRRAGPQNAVGGVEHHGRGRQGCENLGDAGRQLGLGRGLRGCVAAPLAESERKSRRDARHESDEPRDSAEQLPLHSSIVSRNGQALPQWPRLGTEVRSIFTVPYEMIQPRTGTM